MDPTTTIPSAPPNPTGTIPRTQQGSTKKKKTAQTNSTTSKTSISPSNTQGGTYVANQAKVSNAVAPVTTVNTFGVVPAITLQIPFPVWQKLRYFVDNCKTEISGLGYIRRISSTLLVVDDVFLIKQECNEGNTTFDPKAYAEFQLNLVDKNDEREENGEKPLIARLQWHSHTDHLANVGFSAEDLNTINNCQTEWRVSLLLNKGEARAARLDYYEPFRVPVESIKTEVLLPEMPPDVIADCKHQIDTLVAEKPIPATPTYTTSYYNNNRYGYNGGNNTDDYWGGGGGIS